MHQPFTIKTLRKWSLQTVTVMPSGYMCDVERCYLTVALEEKLQETTVAVFEPQLPGYITQK